MEVRSNVSNERIDKFLTKQINLSRSKIQKLIDDNKITIDGKSINSNYKVNIGDLIIIDDTFDYSTNIIGEDIALDIVYEDEDLLVINKPSGMVVHPAPGNYHGTLVNALIYKYNFDSTTLRPGIVHRLDKDTSGLMVVAKNEIVLDKLSEMIKNHEVKRTYLALVEGCFNHETGTIDAPIGRDDKNREKMRVCNINAKEAITHFKVLKRFANATLVECNLETGRTHQIRVHMAYIKHPIVNDPVYGKKIKDNDFGQLLHSTKISFIHPIKNILIEKEVLPPKEFYDLLEEYVK